MWSCRILTVKSNARVLNIYLSFVEMAKAVAMRKRSELIKAPAASRLPRTAGGPGRVLFPYWLGREGPRARQCLSAPLRTGAGRGGGRALSAAHLRALRPPVRKHVAAYWGVGGSACRLSTPHLRDTPPPPCPNQYGIARFTRQLAVP